MDNFDAAHAGPALPGKQACLKFCAMAGGFHLVPGQGEVLTDRTEAGGKRLRTPGIAKALHLALAPRVGWWLFSARLLTRADAFTNTCFTPASSGTSAFAAG
ncbi:hypothetical protein PUN4_650033 [Paraburkholderia unamae]|nr:hypothetical protein PUN4_650033 [Paraburkholderia unamae]